MTAPIIWALIPIGLLIAAGTALRRTNFLAATFWPQAERLSYFVLLPALFLHGLATARLDGLPVAKLAAVLIAATLASAALLVALRPRILVSDPAFTSILQGGIRFNNYVGVTAAASLFGTQGIALAAVANAAIVPTVNTLCVLIFARYGSGIRPGLRGIARQIATNPLVLGCAGGVALQATGLGLPPGIEPALRALGQASLPLGLLCVGAALDFADIRGYVRPLAIASTVKFLVMPGLAWLGCLGFGLHGAAASGALLFQALPTASSSYIMARQMGGDAPLMAGITAAQTILAAAALPLIMTMFG